MADIAAIRAELKSRLSTLLGNDGQALAYQSANPSPPTLQVVGVSEIDYDATFGRGSDTLSITVQGVAGTADTQAAHEQLDAWLDTTGSTSVKAAIESERPDAVTLGGLVSNCRVASATGIRIYQMDNGTKLLGVEFELEIET